MYYHLTLRKKNDLWFILKCYLQTMHLQIIYMNEDDFVLSNLQRFICHKTQPN